MKLTPREGLQRELESRPYLKSIYHGLNVIAVVWGLLVVYKVLSTLSQGLVEQALFESCYLLVSVLFCLQAHFAIRPLAFSSIHVRPDSMSIELKGKTSEVRFEDIEKVEMPKAGSWFTVHLRNGQHHRLSLSIQRSEYILEAIAAKNPSLVSQESFLSYRNRAVVSDHFSARVEVRLKGWRFFLAKFAVLPVVLSSIVVLVPSFEMPTWELWTSACSGLAAASVAIGYLLWTYSELIAQLKLRKLLQRDPTAVRRDLQKEEKIFKALSWLHIGALVLFAIVRSI